MIILTATLASIGTAAVPGAGMIMLTLVLQSVGLPVEGIAIVLGVDRLLDMSRTATNITGDVCVAVVVAKGEEKDSNKKVQLRDLQWHQGEKDGIPVFFVEKGVAFFSNLC